MIAVGFAVVIMSPSPNLEGDKPLNPTATDTFNNQTATTKSTMLSRSGMHLEETVCKNKYLTFYQLWLAHLERELCGHSQLLRTRPLEDTVDSRTRTVFSRTRTVGMIMA